MRTAAEEGKNQKASPLQGTIRERNPFMSWEKSHFFLKFFQKSLLQSNYAAASWAGGLEGLWSWKPRISHPNTHTLTDTHVTWQIQFLPLRAFLQEGDNLLHGNPL